MLGTPAIWLGGALAVCVALFAANVITQHAAEVKGARNAGIAIGEGKSATATLEAAAETAEAFRQAEAEVVIPPERKAIYELCKRRASCRERNLP